MKLAVAPKGDIWCLTAGRDLSMKTTKYTDWGSQYHLGGINEIAINGPADDYVVYLLSDDSIGVFDRKGTKTIIN